MSYIPKNTLYDWFKKKKKPTQEQFWGWMDSYWHKGELIPLNQIQNIDVFLQNTVSLDAFNAHLADQNAHSNSLAKLDASNLSANNIIAWKEALSVGELPANIATVDDYINAVEGNVYNKEQIQALYMALEDFVLNGKIRADKLESLALTTVFKATETTIEEFANNSDPYDFQDNDFIAIATVGGYSLYLFIGGDRLDYLNYLPTGLTNVTISMVEGLQAALSAKMDKPVGTGNYFVRQNGSTTSFVNITSASYYLMFWNGTDFTASNLYYNASKIGMGTTTPTEMIHLNNGRLRAKGVILDANTETLPNQITTDGTDIFGTNSSGIKKQLFWKSDFITEFLNTPNVLTDVQKNTWKTTMNGGWSTATMSVAIVSPPIVDQTNRPFWINLKGANLNLNPANFKVELCTGASASAATATVVAEIPASQVQLYTTGIDLRFYYNFQNIPIGTYKIRLWNGVAYYLTSFTISVVDVINRVDLNNIVWSKKIYNNATSAVITESGASVNYNSDSNVKALADDSSFVAGRKTNQLIAADEDFYMTVEITGKTAQQTNANGSMTHFIGLLNSETTVDLLNQTVVNVRIVNSYWYPMAKFYADNSTTMLSTTDSTYGITAIFMRNGSSWTVIITSNNVTQAFTKTGYTGAISFGMFNQNTAGNTGVSANIVELYKF